MCEYHASVMEPWDGPAAHRRLATASRWWQRSTETAFGPPATCAPPTAWSRSRRRSACSTPTRPRSWSATASSPAGCWSQTPSRAGSSARARSRRALARSRPYGAWLARHQMHVDDLPMRDVAPIEPGERERLLPHLRLHGRADRAGARAARGRRRAGGLDGRRHARGRAREADAACSPTTSASSSRRSPTRPSIPRREALVMSLQTSIGAIGNLLDERPEYCRRVVLPTPVLDPRRARAAAKHRARRVCLDHAARHLPGRRGRRRARAGGRRAVPRRLAGGVGRLCDRGALRPRGG